MQGRRPQGKLVRVVDGDIWDVAVDLRRGSPTYGRWAAEVLSAGNFKQMYLPPGCAHGFCVLSEVAQVQYKCTEFYDPSDEIGIAWDDPDLAIAWPVTNPIMSERDRHHPRMRDLEDRLPQFERPGAESAVFAP
jgi:dTDP-4-dehydrorhamnose 3,5-epimerase